MAFPTQIPPSPDTPIGWSPNSLGPSTSQIAAGAVSNVTISTPVAAGGAGVTAGVGYTALIFSFTDAQILAGGQHALVAAEAGYALFVVSAVAYRWAIVGAYTNATRVMTIQYTGLAQDLTAGFNAPPNLTTGTQYGYAAGSATGGATANTPAGRGLSAAFSGAQAAGNPANTITIEFTILKKASAL